MAGSGEKKWSMAENHDFQLDLSHRRKMKQLGFLVCLLLLVLKGSAQGNRFLYLESEKSQLFYVRLHNQVFSAQSPGYLILPKLSDSTYTLLIGFPKNEYPEQRFEIPIQGRDAGYLLKYLSDKGWVLFNIQTLELIPAQSTPATAQISGTRSNNAFAVMMANAVNDTLILYDHPEVGVDPIAKPLLASKKKRTKRPIHFA